MSHRDPDLHAARTLLMRLVSLVDRGRGGNVFSDVRAFLHRTNPAALPQNTGSGCTATRHDALMICSQCTRYWAVSAASPCTLFAIAIPPQHQPEKQP